MIAGLIVILINIKNVPSGLAMIFKMAFNFNAVGGGLCGAITASLMNAMRYGVARGVFLMKQEWVQQQLQLQQLLQMIL